MAERGFFPLGIAAVALGGILMAQSFERRKFNKAAEGLSSKERAIAEKFWRMGRRQRSEARREAEISKAMLEEVEAARVALIKLRQAIELVEDPSCDQQVAACLVEHWMYEASYALFGEATSSVKALARAGLEGKAGLVREEILKRLDHRLEDLLS